MSNAITILVGTMTGTAELVAEDMQAAIEADGEYAVEVLVMDDLDSDVFQRDGVFLICTATYGQGDVPDNAMTLYEGLVEHRPDLSHVRYGVFGLGDSTYDDTYNFGGQRFDDILCELGARRIGERARHNASSPEVPEELGVSWVRDWLRLLAPVPAAAD